MNLAVCGRFAKAWEGQDPFIVLQLQIRRGDRQCKGYLLVDARSRQLSTSATKPEGLKPSGSVAALLRKHAAAGGIGSIWRGPDGDHWLPLFTERRPEPTYYLHLSGRAPGEISLIEATGETLVRRSTQGTYTKRKPWEGPLPHQLTVNDTSLREVTAEILAALVAGDTAADTAAAEPEPADAHADANAAVSTPAAAPLPSYQRVARDRLARRLKTLKKSLSARQAKAQTVDAIAQLESQAQLLAANLHRVRPGDFALCIDDASLGRIELALDPEKSAGHNLDDLYVRLKKAKKSARIDAEQSAATQQQLSAMTADLARLRTEPLALSEVARILSLHKLPMERETRRNQTGEQPVATAWRRYVWRDGDRDVLILVGKSANGNDELCRSARSNDWWLHGVGVTGSHVLIPNRALRGAAPPAALLRAAAILALHHSPRKDDRRGEVYVTTRQFIKKRPGTPPGLWQVDKAETLFVAYADAELQAVLDSLAV